MPLSASEKRIVAATLKPDSTLGTFASMSLKIWIVLSFFLASHVVSPYLLLVWFYGFARVHKEGLYFTETSTGKSARDYIVSNGDHISATNAFIGFPMTIVVWLAMVLIAYLLIKNLSGWRKEAHFQKVLNDE